MTIHRHSLHAHDYDYDCAHHYEFALKVLVISPEFLTPFYLAFTLIY